MKSKILATACAAAALAFAAPAAQAQELRIGFITQMNHPIGQQMINGWTLGMKHEGWEKDGDQLGGVATRVFFGDDQQKADVGRRVADRMLQSDNVDIIAGIIWSNVLMAVQRPVVDSERILLITNAGAGPMFGAQCSPYFISTAWQNDQNPEAMGIMMNADGIKSAYAVAPNYQAGKDMVAGFDRTFDGKISGQTFFKLGQTDFQAELTRIRAAQPEAVFLFAPGPMGIAFLKQWAASGLKDKVQLYTVFVVDWMTLPAIGNESVGTYHSMYWNVDLDNDANRKFVKDYVAEHGGNPAHYAAQTYDAPRLLAAALRETGGKFDDKKALMKAMRNVQYGSVRGAYKYNVNGAPIQNFYRREVVLEGGQPKIVTRDAVLKEAKDAYWEKCPEANRM